MSLPMEKAFMTNWLVLVSTEKRLSTGQAEDYTTGCFSWFANTWKFTMD